MPLLKVRNPTNDDWIIFGWGEDPAPDPGPGPSIADLRDEPFVVMLGSAVLTAERVLAAGSGVAIVDGGAGGTVTISAGAGVDAFAFFMGAGG